jgi:hypothetical protein
VNNKKREEGKREEGRSQELLDTFLKIYNI